MGRRPSIDETLTRCPSPRTASDGREACDEAERTQVDIILMDCQMPVMDGYEAAREIRRLEGVEHRSRVPIVVLTASAFAEDAEACRRSGMDGFLSKPFRTAELAATLDAWTGSALARTSHV
jgi:CheY-like chemotaxis protein